MNSENNLRAYFPNYLSDDSLFTKMVTLGAPWTSEIGQDMDDAYFTMYSGIKNPSEFVTLHLNPGTEIANSLTIARIMYGIYGDNWTKLWEAFKTKYTPIDNYNLQETISTTRSSDRTVNRTNDLTSTVDGTEKQTSEQDGTQGITGTTGSNTIGDSNGTSSLEHGEHIQRDAEADDYTYGFNSVEKVPTGARIETGTDVHSGTDTTTTSDHSTSETSGTSKTDTVDHATGTVDITTKDVRADKLVDDTLDTSEGKEDIQRTRVGNIGVTTTQQMLQQEFELWRWNFFIQVFEDVDKFLVLSVYSSCTNH